MLQIVMPTALVISSCLCPEGALAFELIIYKLAIVDIAFAINELPFAMPLLMQECSIVDGPVFVLDVMNLLRGFFKIDIRLSLLADDRIEGID